MEIKGKLKTLLPVVEKSNFKSRKVWIITEDNPQYPQTIEIEIQQDKVDLFNAIPAGSSVNCHLNLRGREWVDKEGVTKVFNSLVCWKVDLISSVLVQTAGLPDPKPVPETGDLPF